MTKIIVFREKQEGQEWIPVGCVLTAVVTARGSVSGGGVCVGVGVCVWGRSPSRVVTPYLLWIDRHFWKYYLPLWSVITEVPVGWFNWHQGKMPLSQPFCKRVFVWGGVSVRGISVLGSLSSKDLCPGRCCPGGLPPEWRPLPLVDTQTPLKTLHSLVVGNYWSSWRVIQLTSRQNAFISTLPRQDALSQFWLIIVKKKIVFFHFLFIKQNQYSWRK